MNRTAMSSPRDTAVEIVRRLQEAGFGAFWVGGCVRDLFLREEPDDYDIATSAKPAEIEKLFTRTLAVGRKFGVMVVLEGERQFQVATFREEADYRDGRRPEQVVFSNARADALRRDFTVNGMFYDPVREELHDWVGGRADLEARVIRTIGSPAERFQEDHLRLLRAVRFAARLEFEVEPATFEALRAVAPRIRDISAERVRDELVKLFAPPGREPGAAARHPLNPPARGLELLRQSGLLPEVLPEVAATVACEQSPDFHPEGSVFNHLVRMLNFMRPGSDPRLPWAVLMHDIAKPATASRDARTGSIHFYEHEKIGAALAEEILGRLRFPRREIEAVAAAVRHHMQFKDAPEMRRATLRRMLMRPTFPLELELHRLDCLGSHGRLEIHSFLERQRDELERLPGIRPPLLTGNDLMALGMPPGPELGKWIQALREKQLQDELRTPDEAREWIRKQTGFQQDAG
ncbi:MAG: CCA tRNA nucleotidyltransferase [Verrucomicrobiota bacterium]